MMHKELLRILSVGMVALAAGTVQAQTARDVVYLTGASEALRPTLTGAEKYGKMLDAYAVVELKPDLSVLDERQWTMLRWLSGACLSMDKAFWEQAYGDRKQLVAKIRDPYAHQLALINYGPWDRLSGNAPFIEGFGPKPAGANFYPADMTREEFEKHLTDHPEDADAFRSPYTVIRRDETGKLRAEPFFEAYRKQAWTAATRLEQASEFCDHEGLRQYLRLRAKALRTDDYRASDLAWMDVKDNTIEIVVGPIETYEDELFGYKAGYEAYLLIRDATWSKRLEKYAALLPALQRALPVPEAYKTESPGTDSDLGAYDVVLYGGHCNAGPKTIAINLPNDEFVQLKKGTRRLQLKNAMRAKFDRILLPLAGVLVDPAQRRHITFEAFFGNTMFHEVAHGLGIKATINGQGPVREALKQLSGTYEEGKADVLGLFMVKQLLEQGQLTEGELMDYYVTFLASTFRSIRFGASSAHGRANVIRFNYFADKKAFVRDPATGTYRVQKEQMDQAVSQLSGDILRIQGDGNLSLAKEWMKTKGVIGETLTADLKKVNDAGICVDVVFRQGWPVFGRQ